MAQYVNEGILQDLERRFNQNSPDYLQRKLEPYIPIFVYGSLRKGFHNHSLLKDMPYLGRAQTAIEKFVMMEPDHGGFPLVFEQGARSNKSNPTSGRIEGEVYVVTARQLLELDYLEDNTRMYTRRKQWVWLKDQNAAFKNNAKPALDVWMYISNYQYWRDYSKSPTPMKKISQYNSYDWANAFTTSSKEEFIH